MDRGKYKVMAAIDVGSNALRMMIAQVKPDGEVIPMEDLYQPTNMGKDTFAFGRIQVQSIHDTCDILKGFYRLMQDYKIKDYRAVTTSGIREAENREYVLEQIRIRSGLEVEIINNAQERFLMYKAIRNHMVNERMFSEKGTMIVDIGSGGVEISVYNLGTLKFTEYIKIGSLRLSEVLADLQKKTLDFPSIMEEFIDSRIDFLEEILPQFKINNFIGLGGELKTISGLCLSEGGNKVPNFVGKEELKKLYSKVHRHTTAQIKEEFGLKKNQAQILLPSIILFNSFLNMTEADGIYTPMVSLRHGLLADMVDERYDVAGRKEALNNIISSVWHVGKKYAVDEVHSAFIEKLTLSMFDQMLRVHMLGDKERLYLRVASILHDVGKYLNHNGHDIHSYNIVRFLDIMGFSDEELNLVANIVRYHSDDIPDLSHENYRVLSPSQQIVVSKLAVILRMAEALDISHKQKIKDIKISKVGNELYFDIAAREDILLEEWSFNSNATFFEEVMGNKPVIRRRG
ncbi:Ppx/GppA phosphatase family protein [Acetivibrio cellulolyticus]|uniref:Ppx/GppA phosphatase family protein n=1 Tax=Acetivibrio cellulolyticus TaxID=35830 RepID=UPI0001E2D89D|nr:HD domain-containing protein [Acetivibrio cellulolyticus]